MLTTQNAGISAELMAKVDRRPAWPYSRPNGDEKDRQTGDCIMTRSILFAFLAAVSLALGAPAQAAPPAPSEIKIGELYAGTGSFAQIAMPTYDAFKLWVSQQNATGGVYVGAFHKKIPIKLISYDDQSSPATAATLYNQLITQDKVNLLISDYGSVLTAPAVTIAREHKQFLIDVGAESALFFTKDNPYIVEIATPVTTVALKYLAEFLNSEGAKYGLKRVAIVYSTNDYTGAIASALTDLIKSAGKLKIVYDQGVPTSTLNYTVLINNIAATHPDAMIELGYPSNDIAFMRNLQGLSANFPFVFTLYSGQEMDEVEHAVGAAAMTNVFSNVTGANYSYKTTFGPRVAAVHAMWDKAYPPGSGLDWGEGALQGYETGLVLQQALAQAKSLDQLAIRHAVFSLSGKLTTLDGPFVLDPDGAQLGETLPLGQVRPNGKGGLKLVVVYPPNLANGKPVISK
ncbi:MAG: ABC transporter substrate-binding protein [Acetobacteraceae bacterium]